MESGIELIRECKYLFLRSLCETEDGALSVVLHEGTVGGELDAETLASEPMPEVRAILAGSRAIVHDEDCKVFELTWPNYIAYCVLNESFASPEPATSQGVGRLLIEYSSSVYLDYVGEATFARDVYPGPMKHWSVCCLDHVVHVVSTQAPKVDVR